MLSMKLHPAIVVRDAAGSLCQIIKGQHIFPQSEVIFHGSRLADSIQSAANALIEEPN